MGAAIAINPGFFLLPLPKFLLQLWTLCFSVKYVRGFLKSWSLFLILKVDFRIPF